MGDEPQMSPEAQEELYKVLEAYGSPEAVQKHNLHTFLNEVLKTKDSTKVANLTDEELGTLKYSVRTLKEFQLISEIIIENPVFAAFFASEAENVGLAPSLSRNGRLITLAVTQKRTLADETKVRKPSSSWFKPKAKQEESE